MFALHFNVVKMKSYDLRDLAISYYKDGKSSTEIVRILKNKAHISTICRWIANFKKHGHVLPKFQDGASCHTSNKSQKSVKARSNSLSIKKDGRQTRRILIH